MQRRLCIAALACCASLRALAQETTQRPRHKLSAARIHEALSSRFPMRSRLAGVLQLEVSAPGLLLLPARNKLGASLQVEASGPALKRPERGELDVVFSLRYEPGDRTLRAHQPEILGVRVPGASSDLTGVLQALLPALTKEMAADLVLHRFTDQDLALANTMGFEPGPLTVLDDGLLVEFVPLTRR
ncbi:MAG TPA: DUF1439 domain-containing protein [Ramlibacter sp.]|jgi:hypothetical protein|nr:DUF1439 domain-containing protein [Ramlibacter sp.]